MMKTEIEQADEQELLRLWDGFCSRRVWQNVLDRGGDPVVVERALGDLPEVTAVEALDANVRLVKLLVSRRWYVMQSAREAGATWSEIGSALGMSRQGAHDWYRRAIGEQEHFVGDLHDAERAQAALAGE
jgi:hypothetical protein